MRADPVAIELAWEGHSDELDDMERMLARWMKGKELPTRQEREAEAAIPLADKLKAQFSAHNAALKASKAAKGDKKPKQR